MLPNRPLCASADPQGKRIAQSIGARDFFETSSLLNKGVDTVFESATRAAVLVRDQGHGGIGAAYDKDGNRDSSHGGKRRRGSDVSEKGMCRGCVVA
jgi:Rho family protein